MKYEIKIESGVPIPLPLYRYPWLEMKVGDCFRFPNAEVRRVRAAARAASARHGRIFKLGRTEDGGYACWMVS